MIIPLFLRGHDKVKIVIFPYRSNKGYLFGVTEAEAIDRHFPESRVRTRNHDRYVHWHYSDNGPSLDYLRNLNPDGKCEKRYTKRHIPIIPGNGQDGI